MPNYEFSANTPLDGFTRQYANTEVKEVSDIAIVSIAKALDDNGATAQLMQSHYGAQWPEPGKSSSGDKDQSTWLGLAHDQCFALIEDQNGTAYNAALSVFDGSAYCTEQTDSWAILSINGDAAVSALERICPIDLHESAFPASSVTRTVMEHLAVIIYCVGHNHYWLMSPASSAQSFLHAVDTSFANL